MYLGSFQCLRRSHFFVCRLHHCPPKKWMNDKKIPIIRVKDCEVFFTEERLELKLYNRARSEREDGIKLWVLRCPQVACGSIWWHGTNTWSGDSTREVLPALSKGYIPFSRAPLCKLGHLAFAGIWSVPTTLQDARNYWHNSNIYCRIGSRCCVPAASLSSFRLNVSRSLFFKKTKNKKTKLQHYRCFRNTLSFFSRYFKFLSIHS